MKSFSEQQQDRLDFWNDNFIPKDPMRHGVKKLIETHGHLYVDVPIASDAKGEFAYSRYNIRTFLQMLLDSNLLTEK